jgi:hypothetical protein
LQILKHLTFKALELNANRIVVAVVPASVGGCASMPRSVVAADKLPNCASALNEKVRRNFKAPNALKVGVCVPIELVGEQLLDLTTAIHTRWQADGMNHDQINHCLGGACTKVGRLAGLSALAPSVLPIVKAMLEGSVGHEKF